MALLGLIGTIHGECGVDTKLCDHQTVTGGARGGVHAEPILTAMQAKLPRKLKQWAKSTASPTAPGPLACRRGQCRPQGRCGRESAADEVGDPQPEPSGVSDHEVASAGDRSPLACRSASRRLRRVISGGQVWSSK